MAFEASLTILGDTLTVQLTNTSPVPTLNPNDTLASFYWDILNGASRPTLTYVSATGDVYLADKTNPDPLQTAGANLKAVSNGDFTWQYKDFSATVGSPPGLAFGLGTVGNNTLAPNSFNGNIVDAIDYAIYKGDITTQNLDGKLLVKETATFVFSGVTGFSEGDIVSRVEFGLGTAPDSTLPGRPPAIVPLPAAVWLLGAGLLGYLGVGYGRRNETA